MTNTIINSVGFRCVSYILVAISSCLLVLFPDSIICSIINIIFSILLICIPESFIPLILTTSISPSIPILGFSAFFYYIFLLLVVVSVKSKLHIKKTKLKNVLWLLLFAFWLVLCTIHSLTGEWILTIKILLIIALGFTIASSNILKASKCIEYITDTALMILLIFCIKLIFFPSFYIVEGRYLTTVELTFNKEINPNQAAQYITILSFICLASFFNNKRIIHLVSFAIAMFILFLLKSRTSFFSCIGISVIYIIFSNKITLKKKIPIIILISFVIVTKLLFFPNTSTNSQVSDKEMSIVSVLETKGTGRLITWVEVFDNILPSNPFLGIGVGKENYESFGLDYDSDNMYVDLLAETGIVGFVLFFMFYIFCYIDVGRRDKQVNNICTYLLSLFLLFGIGETVFDSYIFWASITIISIFLFNYDETDSHCGHRTRVCRVTSG